mmetsp:Transcript_1000/g.2985  ORF Transcript_1000/g.2985 Transcript_1000/m.2985 type:complete len:80 (-) Transcript_1000:1544-1783(-)
MAHKFRVYSRYSQDDFRLSISEDRTSPCFSVSAFAKVRKSRKDFTASTRGFSVNPGSSLAMPLRKTASSVMRKARRMAE